MSILTQLSTEKIGVEIDRIKAAKTSIKASIEGKGITVPAGTKIDGMSSYIDAIDTGGGVSLDVITAASLPATVVDGQIVVITDTPAGTIYVDTDEPANPANGDVWVVVGASESGIAFSETFRNGLSGAYQYTGGAWGFGTGYIGKNGSWEQFAFGFPAAGTPLSDWTWQQIIDFANSGIDPTRFFAVGDSKDMELTTGEVVSLVIGDFHHNTITGTGKTATFAFSMHPKCLNTTYKMNNSDTNSDGYEYSMFRKQTIPTIEATLPQELLADGAIKYVDVTASWGYASTTLVTFSDRLRMHSVTEIGLAYSETAVEGSTYAYYAAGNRVKTRNGAATDYWTRSANTATSNRWNYISSNGNCGRNAPSATLSVALAFDI